MCQKNLENIILFYGYISVQLTLKCIAIYFYNFSLITAANYRACRYNVLIHGTMSS